MLVALRGSVFGDYDQAKRSSRLFKTDTGAPVFLVPEIRRFLSASRILPLYTAFASSGRIISDIFVSPFVGRCVVVPSLVVPLLSVAV